MMTKSVVVMRVAEVDEGAGAREKLEGKKFEEGTLGA
jgi:hypothetical protein